MKKESQRKILGAFVVGLALVAGAYTVANFTGPSYTQPASIIQPQAAPRSAIDVSDNDNNGIEDWREEFVTTEPVIVNETVSSEYVTPDTLTGRTGVAFFQDVLEARVYSQNPDIEKEVINSTITRLEEETSGLLYDATDISVITDWNENDIQNYANIMGGAIVSNNQTGLDNEIAILNAVLNRKETDRIKELEVLASYYKGLTKKAVATPVPAVFAKQHLDLINTYHAISLDIEAMTKALDDPIVALVRLRKYEDNSLGLRLALENMYLSLLPYRNLFGANDSALVFSLFAPKQRI